MKRFSGEAFAQAEARRLREAGIVAHVEFSPRNGADDNPFVVVKKSPNVARPKPVGD
ncbi:hypothetical protein [Kaistia nematophila]|uniref:Uncharacterized protein n=1 Tax=Kaistia nematophila TaxID=2994654 RepID=A0A9X3E1T6_9HYPH|nr:hypothetical protein [Kaistia nematophila]MCX5568183.1 hypothetical protein [Kaistia nematophila]